LSKNNDPEISDVSIQNEIAHCYIVLDEYEKGIEILKRYNIGGAHNALIAMTYMGNQNFEPKDAEPYMMGSGTSYYIGIPNNDGLSYCKSV
jgi:hypothetical protein